MKSFHLYAFITILCWSMGNVFTRAAVQYMDASPLASLRYVIAAAALIIIALVTRMKLPHKKDLPWFLVAGATGFFGFTLAFNKGCETVTASTASVILATVPVMTALFACFLYKEKLKMLQWTAIAVEFCGVAILTLLNGIEGVKIGMLWVFLAALSLSIYNLIVRNLTKEYNALQITTFSIFGGTLLLSVFLPQVVTDVPQVPAAILLYIAFMGIFASAIGYAAWAKAFSKAAKTSQVSNYMFLTPFITVIIEFFLLQSIPDTATIAGGCIILLGLFLFNFGGKNKNENNLSEGDTRDEISDSASQ